MDEDVEIKEVP